MDEAGGLTLRVLGELDAIRDGVVVELGGRRQRAALAALIIARGDVVSAERLAECVWGDGAAARGRGRTAFLRQPSARDARSPIPAPAAAPTSSPASAGATPCASDTLDVDAWQFEHALEVAADLPASERVSPVELRPGPVARPGLRRVRGRVVGADRGRPADRAADGRPRGLMDARLALGDAALLVPELEALVAEDPLREERWRLLVLALYRAHRQGDALAALRRARQTLVDGARRRTGTGAALAGTGRAGAVADARRVRPGCCTAAHRSPRPPADAQSPAANGARPDGPGRSRPRTGRPGPGRRRPAGRQPAARC